MEEGDADRSADAVCEIGAAVLGSGLALVMVAGAAAQAATTATSDRPLTNAFTPVETEPSPVGYGDREAGGGPGQMADGLGFEPKTALRLYSISSAAPSTGLGHPS